MYGGTIKVLLKDNDYIYAAGEIIKKIIKYNKDDLSYVSESEQFDNDITALSINIKPNDSFETKLNLISDYKQYYKYYNINPGTDANWTRDDINNLRLGFSWTGKYHDIFNITVVRPVTNTDINECVPTPEDYVNVNIINKKMARTNKYIKTSNTSYKRDEYFLPNLKKTYVYYATGTSNTIYRVNEDGTNKISKNLYTTICKIMRYDNNLLVICHDRICILDVDLNILDTVSIPIVIRNAVYDNDYIYLIADEIIQKRDINTLNLIASADIPYGWNPYYLSQHTVDDNYLYVVVDDWLNETGMKILQYNKNTLSLVRSTSVSNVTFRALCSDNTYLYVSIRILIEGVYKYFFRKYKCSNLSTVSTTSYNDKYATRNLIIRDDNLFYAAYKNGPAIYILNKNFGEVTKSISTQTGCLYVDNMQITDRYIYINTLNNPERGIYKYLDINNYPKIKPSLIEDYGIRTPIFIYEDVEEQTSEINKIELVYASSREGTKVTSKAYHKPFIKIGSNIYYGDEATETSDLMSVYRYTFEKNPETDDNWIWNDVNNLRIGWAGKAYISGSDKGYPRCHNLYMLIYTDIYQVKQKCSVNDLQLDVTYYKDFDCDISNPQEISTDYERNINIINFWSGDREVYDLCRTGRSIILSGMIWDKCIDNRDCDEIIKDIKRLAMYKKKIKITDLNYDEFNNYFHILSVGFKHISEYPNVYEYIIEMEYDE